MEEHHVILGYGVTGKALARFCEDQGWQYHILEEGLSEAPRGGFANLKKLEGLPDSIRLKMAYLSPGIPLTHPWVTWAREKNIPVVGEVAFAAGLLKGKFIGITGTNGKSTTAMLTDVLLSRTGVASGLCGNIGKPLIAMVAEKPCEWYVVEESSFQLETIGKMRHHIAVCLNVSDDHYERYRDITEYAAAKAHILKNSTAKDFFIYNHDDPHCLRMSWASPARGLPLSLLHEFDEGGFVRGKSLVIRLSGKEFTFDLNACSLKGMHNQENMLAALLVALLISDNAAAVASYRRLLAEFHGLPHRVEKVWSENGVDYYDDSKGTNVGAVVMALAGFEGPIILIAGGRDKGGDYTPLKGLLKGKVKKLILLGEARQTMQQALLGACAIEMVANMAEAVAMAKAAARPGDTVLLSPACASFDQYNNYHERGLDFQARVKENAA